MPNPQPPAANHPAPAQELANRLFAVFDGAPWQKVQPGEKKNPGGMANWF